MGDVFKALADPHRRRLLDSLNEHNGQNLRDLCSGLNMARQSVSKHLAVLEAANLVTTLRQGREKLHFLNAEPINAIAERWIQQYHRHRVRTLADLKTALEATMGDTEFVYTTYIKTTPERLWQALTDPTFTRRYWGLEFVTDWTPGAPMSWKDGDVTLSDAEQVVLAAEPPHRLSYTWHAVTPEWAAAHNISDELRDTLASERRSKVTFEIEPLGATVKLTVIHDDFEPGSTMREMVSTGWPELISGLKTLLETGQPLPAADAT
ncbi:ArsR/SmtB family transcription factor [Phytoactinopolyspora limicola]|uniref:ArsR/SmtB family transcription factor n=1 Tax=Phytoactinopolyspora limicola TaxID=2715536 RepID=UPI00140D0B24|nr:metalloregulator ArsR/SmtB family transcription factor [Phytoactinopolyspora limicola]